MIGRGLSALLFLTLASIVSLLTGCVATEVKDSTRAANIRTTIEPAEVEGLTYLESTANEYNGNYAAQHVLAIIANRYADAGRTDLVILVDLQRQPATSRTRALTAQERESRQHARSASSPEWESRTSLVTETVPGDWLVHERVYRSEQQTGVPVVSE